MENEKIVAVTFRLPESEKKVLDNLRNAGAIPVSLTHVLRTLIVEEAKRREKKGSEAKP